MQMNLTTMQGIAAEATGNAGEPVPAADTAPQSYTDQLLAETPPVRSARKPRAPRKKK
jgi:hypothetical protein